jgi:hypothetical protein
MASTSSVPAVKSSPVAYSGRANALEKLQIGSYGTEGGETDWTYYDTMIMAAGTAQHRMFTDPLGAGGKTYAMTNLTVAGQIPQAQLMEIMAIKIMYTSSAAKLVADLQTLYLMFSNTTLALKLSNKDHTFIYTLQEIMGMSLQFDIAPAVVTAFSQPQPRFHGIFPLNKKVVLAALTPFEVQIVHHVAPGAALDGDFLRVGLAGILTRAT